MISTYTNKLWLNDAADGGLSIGGSVKANAPFKVTPAGALTSTSGDIGGWTIGTTLANGTNIILDAVNKAISLVSATFGAKGIQLKYNSGNPQFYVGDGANAYLKFDGALTWKAANSSLDASGNLTASNVDLTGKITATSGSFTGAVTATSGSFTGAITATSGTIAGTLAMGAGKITAGNVTLDTNGLKILTGSSVGSINSVLFNDGTSNVGYLSGYKGATSGLLLEAFTVGGLPTELTIKSPELLFLNAPSVTMSGAGLNVNTSGAGTGAIKASGNIETTGGSFVGINTIVTGAVRANGGLSLGGITSGPTAGYAYQKGANFYYWNTTTSAWDLKGQISVDASWFRINQDVAVNIHTPRSITAYGSIAAGTAALGSGGDIFHTGQLIKYIGTTSHKGYSYVPLLSNATWVGGWENTSRTSGTYTIYVENYSGLGFAPIGSGVRAWNVRLLAKCTSGANDAYYVLARDNTAGSSNYSIALRASTTNVTEACGIVHCDTNGRFNLAINGNWSGIYVQILGYYI